MVRHFGIDSVSPAYEPTGGTTLADYASNVYFGPTGIDFFGRYFSPSPFYASVDKFDPQREAQAMSAAGMHWIAPVSSPGPRIYGTYSDGWADGDLFCRTLSYVISLNAGIYMPSTTGALLVYLDIETDTPISQGYWNGWSDAVWDAEHNGTYPFYPGAYCNPPNGAGNPCGVLSAGSHGCHGVWSMQPEYCSFCWSPFPNWGPQGCAGLPTRLWQYAIDAICLDPGCGNRGDWPNIDLDQSTPERDETYYMLWVP